MASLFNKKRKGKAVAESSNEAPRFKTPFHEAHFKGKLSARKVLPELAIDYNNEIISPCTMQIKMRKWEKLTSPLPAVGHNMVKEFYANAWEPDKAKRKPYTYTTMVQGKDISFAPSNIKRVLRLRKDPLPNAASYEERKANKDYRLEEVLECLCLEGREWVRHKDGRPHFLRRNDLEPMAKGWYDFVCRSIMPTTNRSKLTVERAVLIHSIVIGENINVEEIIAEQFYKFIYKTDLSSSLPFPSIIAALCLDAKVIPHKDDTMIPQEIPIVGEAMVRTRETRSRQPRQPRQEVPPPQQPPQVNQQHELPPSFYTHFDASMSQIYRRLDQQQEENMKSFEAINTRMDRMDDQLSFLCYSNQMSNETMYYPYQNTARQFRDMEAQGVSVTIANLAIHRHREEEMNRERMRHNQTVQEAASQRAREANKGKAREVVPDSEDEESEEMYSSPSEEWLVAGTLARGSLTATVSRDVSQCPTWKQRPLRHLLLPMLKCKLESKSVPGRQAQCVHAIFGRIIEHPSTNNHRSRAQSPIPSPIRHLLPSRIHNSSIPQQPTLNYYIESLTKPRARVGNVSPEIPKLVGIVHQAPKCTRSSPNSQRLGNMHEGLAIFEQKIG
ncbi:hypothetical protein PIB30_030443 [Stylosanthes scabra]|uniref:Putative plant transposon protein domain-containing protein n=1 Tax=Stylosanthes scabra TaxID=79078 RepID=A0ABU6SBG6_9FABA|nr:hypothetical protein [Stylosanthes scabra]